MQLASSPAVVSTAADLEVLVTTSHPLPANAILRIYTSTNVWDRASTIYPETIFRSSPSCNYLNVLGCLRRTLPATCTAPP